jgi:formylglycine-generating enzyme required for sulfatase activity
MSFKCAPRAVSSSRPGLSDEGTFVWSDVAKQTAGVGSLRASGRCRDASGRVRNWTQSVFLKPPANIQREIVVWQNEPKFFQ